MGRTATLSLLVCVVLVGASVAAWAATQDVMSREITIYVQQGAKLGGAVRDLTRSVGLNYSVDQDISSIPCPDFCFRAVPLKTALDNLMKSVGGVYRLDGNVLVVSNSVDSDVMRQWKKHIKSVDFKDMDTVAALRDLFEDSGLNYSISPAVGGKVSLQLSDVPFATALAKLSSEAGFSYRIEPGGVVKIVPLSGVDLQKKKVNLQLKDMPLLDALEKLFEGIGVSYTVDPALSQLKVTAILRDVPFDAALGQIAKAAGAACWVDANAYVIGPKTAIANTGRTPQPGVESKLLYLRNLDYNGAMYFLNQQGIEAMYVDDHKLLIKGESRALNTAIAQVKELDEKSGPARVVQIKITITEENPAGSKHPIVNQPTISAIEGQPCKMTIATELPRDGKADPKLQPTSITVSVMPTIKDDGRILLVLQVEYDTDPTGKQPAQSLSTQVLLDPGVPAEIGKLSSPVAGTKDIRTVTITATATLQNGPVRSSAPRASTSSNSQGIAAPRVPTAAVPARK